ncbi:similar to Saccharomyces cerevisiae YEL016C NPP2 Nucleotide pyrophosphatase/phosphodiesterase family member [Maudiozyma saulgeensis]|uniref:Similar to Saccharomyces cerevisiae YEL016C NPP2 Nucleotide pyrophosphatase/phosphodiesterase family member n=1 Tax=Maudiozyma saulgeensis TaxID=1789683 RepID=A0A1X7R107_9SACH|nr:similar to Saccharomyces cerevisiae YEL016C NPP2 Nucleotide pyrophosphatase/phosphodiesterase family member [Kazachstania saulgeensis]
MNDQDIFEDDFLDEYQDNNENRSWQLWKRAKFWWLKNVVQGTVGNSMERIGVPLYDLSADGHEIHDDNDNDDEAPMFLSHSSIKNQANIRRLKYVALLSIVTGMIVFLMIKIFDFDPDTYDHRHSQYSASIHPFQTDLDPNIRYNNGTHEFYPINIVIKVDGLNVKSITSDTMPLVTKLYTGEFSESHLLKNNSVMIAQDGMIPIFPLSNDANVWSMMTGLTPGKHGVFFDGDNSTLLSNTFKSKKKHSKLQYQPIWSQMEQTFQNFKVAMDSYFVWNHGNYTPTYYLDREPNKKHAKHSDSETIEWIIDLIDMYDIEKRPQLFLNSFINYASNIYSKGSKGQMDDLRQIDTLVTKLIIELNRRHLLGFTNILLVSNFGFVSTETVPYDHILTLNELLNDDSKIGEDINDRLIRSSQINDNLLSIYVDNKNKNEIYGKLINGPHKDHIQVELKGDLHSSWHLDSYTKNTMDKMGDIMIIPQKGYGFKDSKTKDKMINRYDGKKFKLDSESEYILGGYPFNFIEDETKATPNPPNNGSSVFIGLGPAFSANNNKGTIQTVKRMSNRVIYEILTELCGLSIHDRNIESLQLDIDKDVSIRHITFSDNEHEEQDEQDEQDEQNEEEEIYFSSIVASKSVTMTTSSITTTSSKKSNIVKQTSSLSTSSGSIESGIENIISDGMEVIDEIFQWLHDSLSDLTEKD